MLLHDLGLTGMEGWMLVDYFRKVFFTLYLIVSVLDQEKTKFPLMFFAFVLNVFVFDPEKCTFPILFFTLYLMY